MNAGRYATLPVGRCQCLGGGLCGGCHTVNRDSE